MATLVRYALSWSTTAMFPVRLAIAMAARTRMASCRSPFPEAHSAGASASSTTRASTSTCATAGHRDRQLNTPTAMPLAKLLLHVAIFLNVSTSPGHSTMLVHECSQKAAQLLRTSPASQRPFESIIRSSLGTTSSWLVMARQISGFLKAISPRTRHALVRISGLSLERWWHSAGTAPSVSICILVCAATLDDACACSNNHSAAKTA
mmetsp:Transcript_48339/g.114025  ORF Transcript_48339/g.114025 Transcript_48339/m.114025 type:complete len:207 (+) Transcript_48339:522-1142(+)